MYKVLILGAGMVSRPIIEYLLDNHISVTVASPMKEHADSMIGNNPLGNSVDWSMDDPETLETLVEGSDIAVSLLPYRYHADVAKVCLKHGKSLVTTSYIQPEMISLADEAKKAPVLFLNEIGLDPGIDHMSAMKIIDHIHSNGGRVEQFWSLCGALPAPEAANNPLKYKFSWSPKGVVLAGMNGAVYLKGGKKVIIDPADLFRDRFSIKMPDTGELEVYPNRDSISYIDIYGIPEVTTMYRGTFRYPGWCETLDAMKQINMLDSAESDYNGWTFSDFLAERAGAGKSGLRNAVARRLDITEGSIPVKALEFLGFFSDEPMGYKTSSPFEITSDAMIRKMELGPGERDMVIMQHIFLAVYPGNRKEVIRASMTDFGTPGGNTAIARTVALPAAIAVKMILEGKINLQGIYRPVVPQIYIPVLDELKKLGISMKEESGLPVSELLTW